MKKIYLSLILLCVGISSAWGQSVVDTLYYDAERLGVEHPTFASYYKIIMTSSNPETPNRFRDYSMDGKLIAEGNFISIDKNSDFYSVYDGQCYDYNDRKIGFLYDMGDMIKFTVYDDNNPKLVRYEIELTRGTPNGYEREFDETGQIVYSYRYVMGCKVQEIIDGETWNYTPHGNSDAIKISTSPKVKTIRDLYKDHNNITNPYNTNCQEIYIYNNTQSDMLVGIKNIHVVHCSSDGSIIFPTNCAWDGNSIVRVAKYKINADLKNIASNIKAQATRDATIVTKTRSSTRGGSITYYNNGNYGTAAAFLGNSKDFLNNSSHSSTTTTSTTVDKSLQLQLLKEGQEKYDAIELKIWENYEKFQELIVDTIVLPTQEGVTKVIGFQTHFWYEYGSKDYKQFATHMDSVILSGHKIFITYDLVDLKADTLIATVSDMYEAISKTAMSDYKRSKNNVFIDFHYAGLGANTPNPINEPTDLYYLSVDEFSKCSVKEDKKNAKNNPDAAAIKKRKHAQRIAWLQERIKATL